MLHNKHIQLKLLRYIPVFEQMALSPQTQSFLYASAIYRRARIFF
jgi:hypothetical protein